MVDLSQLIQARERLAHHLTPTPVEHAAGLGKSIWLKLENLNPTHSFKVRGALNAVLTLTDSQRRVGVLTASSGNHALGLAFAAQLTQTRAQVYMPTTTPRRKISGVRRYGAEAVLMGENYDATESHARQIARDSGTTFISPYNDRAVIAGAGTIGLEILDQLSNIGRVIVCVSGGGLISGIGLAIKALAPHVELIGVNAQSAPAMYNYLYGTRLPQQWHTLADALSGEVEAASLTFGLVQRLVDRMVLVDEDAILEAIRWLHDEQGWIVEGGGAVGVAAVLSGAVPNDARPTVIVVTGGNIDAAVLQAILCGDTGVGK